MEIIKINNDENFDPMQLVNIDKKSSIVFSTTESSHNIYHNDENMYITTHKPIDVYSLKLHGTDFKYDHDPNMRITIPKGMSIDFVEAMSSNPLLKKIYPNMIEFYKYQDYKLINNFTLTLCIDRHRLGRRVRIISGDILINLVFSYEILAKYEVQQIYIIQNNFVYTHFVDHFGEKEES
jgi:hypothetical protein